jgi:hypothetical protein
LNISNAYPDGSKLANTASVPNIPAIMRLAIAPCRYPMLREQLSPQKNVVHAMCYSIERNWDAVAGHQTDPTTPAMLRLE